MVDTRINQVAVGAFLKAHREHKDMSQKTIADTLKYKNVNYISILESGRANIPLAKIKDIARAYDFDPKLTMILAKKLAPECWNLIMDVLTHNPEITKKTQTDIEKETDKKFIDLLKEYSLGTLAKLQTSQGR